MLYLYKSYYFYNFYLTYLNFINFSVTRSGLETSNECTITIDHCKTPILNLTSPPSSFIPHESSSNNFRSSPLSDITDGSFLFYQINFYAHNCIIANIL